MKTKSLIALLILSASSFYNIQKSNAQGIDETYAQKVYFANTIDYMAIVNNNQSDEDDRLLIVANAPIKKNEGLIEAGKLNAKALYMASEQFVFDNLASIKKDFSVEDIYFDLDDAGIRPDAVPVLDNLVKMMRENPGISVATTAYSDSRMTKYNGKLAMSRAQAANAYLISEGISADRIVIEKHGRPAMANPCNDDPSCSLAVQQLNRRTEFNIIFNGINLGQTN